MFDSNNLIDLLLGNMKKLFFPEEWLDFDLKFSKSELFTMLLLEKRKEITMTELVEYINIPMSTATGIADRLVRNGYVRRDRGETDRRIVVLRLTEEGSWIIARLKELVQEYISVVVDDLTEEEKQFLIRIIMKVMSSLQDKSSTQVSGSNTEKKVKKIEIE